MPESFPNYMEDLVDLSEQLSELLSMETTPAHVVLERVDEMDQEAVDIASSVRLDWSDTAIRHGATIVRAAIVDITDANEAGRIEPPLTDKQQSDLKVRAQRYTFMIDGSAKKESQQPTDTSRVDTTSPKR